MRTSIDRRNRKRKRLTATAWLWQEEAELGEWALPAEYVNLAQLYDRLGPAAESRFRSIVADHAPERRGENVVLNLNLPLGAVGLSDRVAAHFKKNVCWGGHTYNAHPVAAAAALAVQKIIKRDCLLGAATVRGTTLRRMLRDAFGAHPHVGDIRGRGLLVGLERERVLQGLAVLADQPRGDERALRAVADYGMPNVSDKVVRILHSYTDYVNRVVWRKGA